MRFVSRGRRGLLPLALLALALTIASVALARTRVQIRDTTVAGAASNQYPTPAGPGMSKLTVDARSEPNGDNPMGTVTASGTIGAPGGTFAVSGPITCVRVVGHRVAIKYRLTKATGSAAAFLGGGIQVFVADNGRPKNGQSVDANASDLPMLKAAFDPNAGACDDPTNARYDTVSSGDYTISPGSVTHVTVKAHHPHKAHHRRHRAHHRRRHHQHHVHHASHKHHGEDPDRDH